MNWKQSELTRFPQLFRPKLWYCFHCKSLKNFFIFSTQKVFHFFHLLQLQVFFTFFTSQNELKSVRIYMVFTAFLPQKCLKFFSPFLGIVKNISSGGGAWKKKHFFFLFKPRNLVVFPKNFSDVFFNHFSFYLFSFFSILQTSVFFSLYCLT